MDAIILHRCYKVRINYLRTDDLGPDAAPNGSVTIAQALWIAEDRERFAGDVIFQPANGVGWIPQREIEVLQDAEFGDYLREMKASPKAQPDALPWRPGFEAS